MEAGQSCGGPGGPGGPGGGTPSLKICHQGIPEIRYTMIGTEKKCFQYISSPIFHLMQRLEQRFLFPLYLRFSTIDVRQSRLDPISRLLPLCVSFAKICDC